MLDLFINNCEICGTPFRRKRYSWQLHGQSVWLCPQCNARLDKRASALAFGKPVDPLPPLLPRTGCASTSVQLTGLGCVGLFVAAFFTIGAIANRMSPSEDTGSTRPKPVRKVEKSESKKQAPPEPVPSTSQRATSPPPASAPAVPLPSVPSPVPPRPIDDMLTLESTDGRTIRAKILTVTPTSVFVRRSDDSQFEIPVSKLTPQTMQKIEEYRAAKREARMR